MCHVDKRLSIINTTHIQSATSESNKGGFSESIENATQDKTSQAFNVSCRFYIEVSVV